MRQAGARRAGRNDAPQHSQTDASGGTWLTVATLTITPDIKNHRSAYRRRQCSTSSSRTRAKPAEGSAAGDKGQSNLAARRFAHGRLKPALRASPAYQPRQPPGLSSRTRAKPAEGSAVGVKRRSNLAARRFVHGGLEPALRDYGLSVVHARNMPHVPITLVTAIYH